MLSGLKFLKRGYRSASWSSGTGTHSSGSLSRHHKLRLSVCKILSRQMPTPGSEAPPVYPPWTDSSCSLKFSSCRNSNAFVWKPQSQLSEVSEPFISCISLIYSRPQPFENVREPLSICRATLHERLETSRWVSTHPREAHTHGLSLRVVPTCARLLQRAQDLSRCHILASKSVQTRSYPKQRPQGRKSALLAQHATPIKLDGSLFFCYKKIFRGHSGGVR